MTLVTYISPAAGPTPPPVPRGPGQRTEDGRPPITAPSSAPGPCPARPPSSCLPSTDAWGPEAAAGLGTVREGPGAGRGAGLTFGHVLVDGPLDLREAPLEVVAARGAAAASGSCKHNGAVRPAAAPARPRGPRRPAQAPHLPWQPAAGRAGTAADQGDGLRAAAAERSAPAAATAAAAAGERFFSLFKMAPNARRPAR